MDKYDEMARKMSKFICECHGEQVYCPRISAVAKAMRECAAQAYEDAAMELWGPDHGARLLAKAAALRSNGEEAK